MSNELATTTQIAPVAAHPVAVYLASLAESSRRVVLGDLNAVAAMLKADADAMSFPWAQIHAGHIAAVRSIVQDRYAPATANRILSSVRGVLKSCWRLGILPRESYDRAVDVPSVKGSRVPSGRALSSGEMRSLFAACADGSNGSRRDSALFAILYAAGLRRDEVVQLELSDLQDDGRLLVRHGKGNKQRTVYLVDEARAAVQAWLEVRGVEPGPLLMPVTAGGRILWRSMAGQAVLGIVAKRAAQAGIKTLSPHEMRKSFVTDMLELGVSIAVVSRMAGHSDVSTTANYDRSGEAAKVAAAKRLHVPYQEPTNA